MTENMKTKAFKRRGGCDEDCMNCPYPDGYKPTMSAKRIHLFPHCSEKDQVRKNLHYICLLSNWAVPGLTDLIYQENFIYEGCTMINFIIGLIIGAIVGYGVCAILSANGRD